MKMIYIIRHADKNKETGQLTDEGRERAKKLKEQLGIFNFVITADRPRLTETATLLTGLPPMLDERAGFVYSSAEEKEKLHVLAKVHPLSHAGVIFENPEFEHLANIIGQNLLDLVKETFIKLPQDGKALIVAQDGVMMAAKNLVEHKPYKKLETSFKPLEGFVFTEDLIIQPLIT